MRLDCPAFQQHGPAINDEDFDAGVFRRAFTYKLRNARFVFCRPSRGFVSGYLARFDEQLSRRIVPEQDVYDAFCNGPMRYRLKRVVKARCES